MNEFQRSSSSQGRAFEEAALVLFRAAGWGIQDTRAKLGDSYPEVDIVATDPRGLLWWIECKGSWNRDPGLERGDTVKKAVGVAAYLEHLRWEWSQDGGDTPIPYMLIASHLPRVGTLPETMLQWALKAGLFTEIRVLTMEGWT